MTTAWNWYVIVLILFNLLGITWLLWWTSKRRPGDPKPDETSHYWDGDITEYNKPMPRWWINGFYIAIVFAFGYLFWYGGFGTTRALAIGARKVSTTKKPRLPMRSWRKPLRHTRVRPLTCWRRIHRR